MNARLKIGTILAGAALAITTIAGAVAAGPADVLPNGDFSSGTAGWNVIGDGTLTKPMVEGAQLANTYDKIGQDSTVTAYQCIPVKHEAWYAFSGKLAIPEGQERTGSARYVFAFYPTNNCGGVALDVIQSQEWTSSLGGWRADSIQLDRTSEKTAYSMSIALVVKKDATSKLMKKGKPFVVNFDDLRVREYLDVANDHDCPCVAPEPPAQDEPAGPVIQPPAQEEPAPEPETPAPAPDDQPVPGEPVAEPTTDDNDSTGTDDAGQTADDPVSVPAEPSGAPQQSDSNPATGPDQPAPAAQPTLEPQPTDGTHVAHGPTPGAPATGGDSTAKPASGLSDSLNAPEAVPALTAEPEGPDGIPLPLIAGGLLAAAVVAIGIVLGRRYRQ